MKKLLKITGIVVLSLIGLVLITGLVGYQRMGSKANNYYKSLGPEAPTLSIDGVTFRDLNKNGRLDIYEDINAPLETRVDDLVGQMTLEEKAGSMFVTMAGISNEGGFLDKPSFSNFPMDLMLPIVLGSGAELFIGKQINNFNILFAPNTPILAKFTNTVQKYGERSRLGIPMSIASDPRHTTENNPGAALFTPSFSQWPSFLGLAATRDTVLVREFGDIARQEYVATGIRVALHPMADLMTEPRWGRSNGTFGEDAYLSAEMTKAYVLGFQGETLGPNSVACMTKHFSGGGPQLDGEDPHFPYGKEQAYPGDNFDYHLIPFTKGAFAANSAQIMPYYGIPMGQTDEDVAFAFNKAIITTLLRDSLGFDGVVCTDWMIISDSGMGEARAWGVEELTPLARIQKVIDAGCDQFGGESVPELVIELVNTGQLTEERIDISVKRIMRDKFRLGLFDNPYVDETAAVAITGNDAFRSAGKDAQAKSTVLLKNDNILPLSEGVKVYAKDVFDQEEFAKYAEMVDSPEEADVVVIRINTPFDPRSEYFLESFFHQGRLYYTDEELNEILEVIKDKPSIVIANLDRPAILTDIMPATQGLIAEFGTTDEIMAEILFGVRKPEGKLPFELPSSWEAVLEQHEDVPYDSKDPLYPFGHGLRYEEIAL
jgi:beta-glucosidase